MATMKEDFIWQQYVDELVNTHGYSPAQAQEVATLILNARPANDARSAEEAVATWMAKPASEQSVEEIKQRIPDNLGVPVDQPPTPVGSIDRLNNPFASNSGPVPGQTLRESARVPGRPSAPSTPSGGNGWSFNLPDLDWEAPMYVGWGAGAASALLAGSQSMRMKFTRPSLPEQPPRESDFLTPIERMYSGGKGSTGPGSLGSGPGSSMSNYVDAQGQPPRKPIDDDRNLRFFPELYAQFPEGPERDAFFNSDVMTDEERKLFKEQGSLSNQTSAIMEVVSGSRGLREVLSNAIDWSLNETDKFVKLQIQLREHGYTTGQMTYGVWTPEVGEAISQMLNGKWQFGADQNLTEFLGDQRQRFRDATYEQISADLEAKDELTSIEFDILREQIESINLSNTLTATGAIERVAQSRAMERLGRSLTDEEMNAITADVHEEERTRFWANDPNVLKYNQLQERWQDLITNTQERADEVLGGQADSDLDIFMEKLWEHESKNMLPDQIFDFDDDMWSNYAAMGGHNPNDRSIENRKKVARTYVAHLFNREGDWRRVAVGWDATVGGTQGFDNGPGPSQGGFYDQFPVTTPKKPESLEFADTIISRMLGYEDPNDELQAAKTTADMEAAGMGQYASDPEGMVDWYRQERQIRNERAMDLTEEPGVDIDMSEPVSYGHEYEAFDVASYLESAVLEAGGAEADAWAFAKQALNFFDLLGRR